MSDSEIIELQSANLDLSGVKIETTAKGLAQLTVRVYGDISEEEMQRRKDLAIRTYEVALRELGQRAQLAG